MFFDCFLAFFENCLKLAQKHQRPVHIHGHKAWFLVAQLLKCFPDVVCLVHRYTGNEQQTRQFEPLDNVYFSVMSRKPTTFLPKDKILIESDAPDGIHYSEPMFYKQLFTKLLEERYEGKLYL